MAEVARPTVAASAGPMTLAGSPSKSYFVANSVLSQFTRFLGVPFSDIHSYDLLFMIMILKLGNMKFV